MIDIDSEVINMSVAENIREVEAKIAAAAAKSGRKAERKGRKARV